MYIRSTFPPILLYYRNRKKSEFMRKINFIFSFNLIINLFLGIIIIVFFIIYIIINVNITYILKNSIIFNTPLLGMLKKEEITNEINYFTQISTLDNFLNKSLSILSLIDLLKFLGSISTISLCFKVRLIIFQQ